MKYSNEQIPEGINVSEAHPLADFAALIAGVAGLCLVLFMSLYAAAGWLLPYVPFAMEQVILDNVPGLDELQGERSAEELATESYLRELADRLIEKTPLPAGMSIAVHYNLSDQQNAFATLGGNIIINRGLLEAVKSENGLAMVLGHEIGHIVNRDPLMATGRGAVTVTAIALIGGLSQNSVAETVFSLSAESLLMNFSRQQERAADQHGLFMIEGLYGHRQGADEFFRHALEQDPDASNALLIEFFSTHPGLEERIDTLASASIDNELQQTGLTPLPEGVADLPEG